MKKQYLIIVSFVCICIILFVFFLPKPSSSYPTEFSYKQKIASGMSESEAKMKMRWEIKKCSCLGFEIPTRFTSYYEQYDCYGLVTQCIQSE